MAVCRNPEGVFLGSSSMVLSSVTDTASLEEIRCLEALALAVDLALQNTIIASDPKELFTDLSCCLGGLYGAIVRGIILTLLSFMKCSFIFKGQASDVRPINLAKFSHSLGRDEMFG